MDRFRIIFEKLDQEKKETKMDDDLKDHSNLIKEIDEIEALREIILEIEDQEPIFLTTS